MRRMKKAMAPIFPASASAFFRSSTYPVDSRRYAMQEAKKKRLRMFKAAAHTVGKKPGMGASQEGPETRLGRKSATVRGLDVINVHLLTANTTSLGVARRVAVVIKLKVAIAIAVGAVRVRLVNLGVLGQLAVGLERARLLDCVLEDDVPLVVLVVTKGEKNDVTLVDPDLLAQFATNVGQSSDAVHTLRLETPVPEHLHYLGVFLPVLLERQLALLIVGLVLSSASVLAALSLVLRHIGYVSIRDSM